jgi:hypothetical protein
MRKEQQMFSDDASVQIPKLNLPAELVAEVSRRNNHKRPTDFRVDGWKPTLLERLARMFGLG